MRTPVRFWPIESLLRSKLYQRRSMVELCISHDIICPEEISEMPPVAMPLEHRTMVAACQHETTLDHEWKRVAGYKAKHAATIRYIFSNVLATPNGFFVGGHGFNKFGHPALSDLLSSDIPIVDQGFFGLSAIGMKYFGHWVMDGLPNTLLKQSEEKLYFPANPSWKHAKAYLDLLDIERIEQDYVLFETMSFCVDIGQNSNRRSRTRCIQEAVRSKFPRGNKRVYISRGDTGVARNLLNEAELVAALEAEGFLIVPVTAALQEILAACSGANLTVSIEGSHMSHAFFVSNPDAFHLTINPADRFNNVFADYMPSLDMRLGTFVAQTANSGYVVDIPGLLEFVEKGGANAR